jgi:hypothetical protein
VIFGNKLLICIPVYNRFITSSLCIPSVATTRGSAILHVYNDVSVLPIPGKIDQHSDQVINLTERHGSTRIHHKIMADFAASKFDFLYLTESDCFHDPDWLKALESWYGLHHRPITLYRENNKCGLGSRHQFRDGVTFTSKPPGKSVFMTKLMVQAIFDKPLGRHWEHSVRNTIDSFCTPEVSLIEHYGAGGLHNSNYESDRAVNPSNFLKALRQDHVGFLSCCEVGKKKKA